MDPSQFEIEVVILKATGLAFDEMRIHPINESFEWVEINSPWRWSPQGPEFQ
jgi:hypothetical protein